MGSRKRAQPNGKPNGNTLTAPQDLPVAGNTTDYARWRLLDDDGIHTWHYLETDSEIERWPQTIADKWHLGLDTGLPDAPKANTPLQAAANGMSFFSHLQLEPGNWGCEYGGPMFLLPGLVVTLYAIDKPLPRPEQIEIIRYIFNMQNVGLKNGGDGGWGLHIEGDSSVFGTAMNYTALRLLGVSPNDQRMQQARECLHNLGGALTGPHWAKFWLSVLGVTNWDVVNPVPPELWLLPDWTPISPWRWWIHMRQVFLPMGFIWSKQWTYPRANEDPLIEQLREELFVQPYGEIVWAEHRNSISHADNYNPKTWVLNLINWILVVLYLPYMRFAWLVERAERWSWRLIQMEDQNSNFADLAPVNAPMNTLCCYIEEGPDAHSVKRHVERLQEFLWVGKDGMMMNGTNGVQNWDTAFAIQAAVEAGLAAEPRYHRVLTRALGFLETQQIIEHPVGYEGSEAFSDPPTAKTSPDAGYRHARRGAWGFSNRDQGYTVSDCTSEALKSILMLQNLSDPKDSSRKLFPSILPDHRIKWGIDIILTMQNSTGACSSYEPARGSERLEYLNAAEVFGRIMVEYDYPECTTACVTTLQRFSKLYPDYRRQEIDTFITRAISWIRSNQRADGSWYGSWAICFTYAGMFALESLAMRGEQCDNSERVRRACKFFFDRQNEDGGWGESYKSCETAQWCQHPDGSQVVQTAWADSGSKTIIALLEAGYPDKAPIAKAIRLLMQRQQANGEWLQEGIEGVFNKSCMISYPNYKFIFPIKALGMYAKKFGDSI
ncbi:ERG7, lanosterol synthase [Polychaeton citri CBS 116435]|uniref:Terpene cyclase/mutase family member n=1 Tax=Polychaeton citri CBS 116435 TaxID=1314669 RepID=A0A9P4UR24_9PEZI|nr:ERG7, lanosterol synthase [Polychaeton citri CBS 116435]